MKVVGGGCRVYYYLLKVKYLNHFFITIEAVCKTLITVALANQNILGTVEKCDYLKELRLFDDSNTENRNIDLMVGLDY